MKYNVEHVSPVEKIVKNEGADIFIKQSSDGFWQINFLRGVIPKRLKSRYTVWEIALTDISNYLDANLSRKKT